MAKIYENISSLIKTARLSSAAATLGETEQKVSSSVDIILPALLARLLKKGNTPEIRGVVEEAGNLKMFKDYDKIWDGNGIFDDKNMGVRMENQLLGVSNPEFYSAVGTMTGIGKDKANRLTTWVAGTIAAFLGEKSASKISYAEILSELGGEKNELRKDIPAKVASILGLGGVLGAAAAPREAGRKTAPVEKKKSYWWLWLLLVIALLVIIFSWRSCRAKHAAALETAVVTEQPAPATTPDTRPLGSNEVRFTLPDGSRITAFKGGCEECVMNFLNSDRFKNATDEELAKTWFEFDNIKYEHNSATEFMPGSERQVSNLVAILKNYPSLKFKIGAFADATGTQAVNYEITEMRAANIKKAFENAGIDASRISTEGFGKTFAEVAANAPDSERARDRDIALRFTR